MLFLINNSEAFRSWAETLAILIGGFWVLWTFCIRRENKPAVDVDLDYTTIQVPDGEKQYLTYFDIALTNKGRRQVTARMRKKGQPAFEDENEILQHSVSHIIRRAALGPAGTQVRWFNDAGGENPAKTDIVANLLHDYEYDTFGKTGFWIELSENSHLCAGVVLQPGIYLAMVTFVGEPNWWQRRTKREAESFWRRVFIVEIPKRNPQSHTAQESTTVN